MRSIVAAIFGFVLGTFAEQWATDCNHDRMIEHAFNAGYRAASTVGYPNEDRWIAGSDLR